ncbi:MAG: AbrB/MazE/SpoVT family DNA-binding domain-containing protein [Thermoleophilia bacterium]
MNTAKISSKYQIVIPKKARKALGLSAGDEVVVVAQKDRIELVPRPRSYTNATLGLGKEVWKGVDAVKYVKGERKAWEKKDRS